MDTRAFDCFSAPGQWYTGNLHSHTTNSDGAAAPEEVVAWYARNGYDFLCITDHDCITDVSLLDGHGMLLIPGIEFGYIPDEAPDFFLDMLGINVAQLPAYLDPDGTGRVHYDSSISPQRIIDDVRKDGALAIMCHPYFWLNMTEPYLRYTAYDGLEAYNYVCEELCGRGNQEVYWDTALHRGRRLWGFATDDSHLPDFGHAWIEVKAKEKTVVSILEAIRQGRFYSTTGIRIFDVTYDDQSVSVTFDRPCDVAFMTNMSVMVRARDNTHQLVDGTVRYTATVPFPKDKTFLRIELIDAHGKKAYTNPVYFGD